MKPLRNTMVALLAALALLTPLSTSLASAQVPYRILPVATARPLPNYGPAGFFPGGLYAPRTFSVYSRGLAFLPWQYEGTYRTYSEAVRAAAYLRLAFNFQVIIRCPSARVAGGRG